MRLQRIRQERPSCHVCGREHTFLFRFAPVIKSSHLRLWSCWRPSHMRQVILELDDQAVKDYAAVKKTHTGWWL